MVIDDGGAVEVEVWCRWNLEKSDGWKVVVEKD